MDFSQIFIFLSFHRSKGQALSDVFDRLVWWREPDNPSDHPPTPGEGEPVIASFR